MPNTIKLTTHGLRNILPALLAFLLTAPVPCAPAPQVFAREVEARLATTGWFTDEDQKAAASGDLSMLIGEKSLRVNGRIELHGLEVSADHATTGWFVIRDAQQETLFTGRWMATTWQNSASLLSLEGRGETAFAGLRLKLKLKIQGVTETNAPPQARGEGHGEIR
ncbi:MAG: hypothetical protein ACKV2V_02080 [Blastocatellia bacterium]